MNPNCVLVVDDDSGMRSALEARFLRRGWRAETAASSREALARFRQGRHALVVTDIRMPGGDGLGVMREARALAPHTAVILLTAFASVPEAVAAMKDGACDYVPKQLSSTSLDIMHIQADLISKIKAAAHSRGPRSPARKPPQVVPAPERETFATTPAIVALGTSTGGPKALQEILPLLTPDLAVPILIVQHMPAGFTTAFAMRLNSLCKVPIHEATHQQIIQSGAVYIAPAGRHMTVERHADSRSTICLSPHPENHLHIPSVDILMQSVAAAYRSLAMGVILTGMGSDGALGMKAIHRAGGITVGQDEATSVVYGMPRACAQMGILDRVVPLPQIPRQIMLATHSRKRA